MARELKTVGVVGLGTMGAGIAQIALQAGSEVVGREVSEELNERARGRIEHFLGRAVEKGKLDAGERDAALARLRTTTEIDELAECDLVIEAIVEELDAKRELFAELDASCSPDAILATNTSALSVTQIAAATERPERVIGMHFFNPAPLLPLVEIVRTEQATRRRSTPRTRGRSAPASSPFAATTRRASSSTASSSRSSTTACACSTRPG